MTNWLGDAGQAVTYNPSRLSLVVVQANDFLPGEVIRHDGTSYVRAQADTAEKAEWLGVVEIASTAQFTLILQGSISLSLPVGTYFLSSATAGAISLTEPSSPYISAPILRSVGGGVGIVWRLRPVVPGVLLSSLQTDSLAVNGATSNVVTSVTTNTTLSGVHHNVTVDCTSGPITITLPLASSANGRVYHITKIDGTRNLLVINPSGLDVINAQTTLPIAGQFSTVDLVAVSAQSRWITMPYLGTFGGNSLIGVCLGADMNSTADQAFTLLTGNKFYIRRITALNASASLTTAAGGIYTGASKSGTIVVAAAQVYSTLTDATKIFDLTLVLTQTVLSGVGLNLSLTTAQGSAATADLLVYGDILQ